LSTTLVGGIAIDEQQIEVVLVAVQHLCAQDIRVFGPLHTRDVKIIIIAQIDLFTEAAATSYTCSETNEFFSPALGYLKVSTLGYNSLWKIDIENSGIGFIKADERYFFAVGAQSKARTKANSSS
jgi:hypothetical protein